MTKYNCFNGSIQLASMGSGRDLAIDASCYLTILLRDVYKDCNNVTDALQFGLFIMQRMRDVMDSITDGTVDFKESPNEIYNRIAKMFPEPEKFDMDDWDDDDYDESSEQLSPIAKILLELIQDIKNGTYEDIDPEYDDDDSEE